MAQGLLPHRGRIWLFIVQNGWSTLDEIKQGLPSITCNRPHSELANMVTQGQVIQNDRKEYGVTLDCFPPRDVSLRDIFNATKGTWKSEE